MSIEGALALPLGTASPHSILYPHGYDGDAPGATPEPSCFPDLLLNQVVATLVRGREDYDLAPLYYSPLRSTSDIEFRHEVWRDLERTDVATGLRQFTGRLREVRHRLTWASKTRYVQHRRGIHLDAVRIYCGAVSQLSEVLGAHDIASRALLGIRDVVNDYVGSAEFAALGQESRDLTSQLAEVRYSLNVRGPRVRVLKYEGEADFGAEIQAVFERFQQGLAKDYRIKFSDWPDMDHVEAQIADRVALLFREPFSRLRDFCERTKTFVWPDIDVFDRELQFYLSYLDFIDPLKAKGLPFCLPEVSGSKAIVATQTFDIALANKLSSTSKAVVGNDLSLEGPERIVVVSGPNQGGKTTFARTFGQIHFLASLGCPVPGERARLFLFDTIFTHFGKEEDPTFQSGKLEDDLLRIQGVLKQATDRSIIIMNEIFASTTSQDALLLGTKVLRRVIELDALCVVVSFIDELTHLGPSILSMTSSVNPDDPVERTFKIIRHPADGLAYAISIAEKYGLTYERLKRRITP